MSVMNASHFDTCVFESIDHFPPNIPNSTHSTQLYIFEDNAAVFQMINKGRRQNLRHVTRTHRVDVDYLFESEFGSLYFGKTRANNRSLGAYLEEGNVDCSFSRKPFSCSALAQAMSQVLTQADCVDQMWDQYSSQVWKSSCILGDIVALEQWSNHEFTCTRNKRDFAGMLSAMNAEGNFLQVESSSQISRVRKVFETIGPVDKELSKMHETEVHVISDSVLCLGKQEMNMPEIKFNIRWKEHLE